MDAAIEPLHPLLNGNAEIPLCGLAAGKIPSPWVQHRIGGRGHNRSSRALPYSGRSRRKPQEQ